MMVLLFLTYLLNTHWTKLLKQLLSISTVISHWWSNVWSSNQNSATAQG